MKAIAVVALVTAMAAGCTTVVVVPETTTVSGTPTPMVVPPTILMRGERLAQSKVLIARKRESLMPAYAALLDSARAAMITAPLSVTQKLRLPPSGDRHDFMSMAPYWWPDTTKPGGVPFVRRDGVVYPQSRTDHDGWRMQAMTSAVQALALAYYFTGDARYATAAQRHLRVWFLDSATRMNPNLKYAQAVLGVTEGRGTGIIDTRMLPDLLDALRLLQNAPGWTADDQARMLRWHRDYLGWLVESANGREERDAPNNHGTFYDEQVAALALFVGDTALARRTIDVSAKARIESHIKADGSQPLELERTRPLHYSMFNLDAYTMLAEMGRHLGVDLWSYTAPSGGSIIKAIRYAAPYADERKSWPTPQVSRANPDIFLMPLRRAAAVMDDGEFARALQFLPPALLATDVSRFAFPTVP